VEDLPVLRQVLRADVLRIDVHVQDLDLAHLVAIVPEALVVDVHVVEVDPTPALLHVTRAPIHRRSSSDLLLRDTKVDVLALQLV
jgi:hypothetical protein